jgi:hypothetical protein
VVLIYTGGKSRREGEREEGGVNVRVINKWWCSENPLLGINQHPGERGRQASGRSPW